MTTLERMAAFAAGLRLPDIPARVREKARWQLASVLGASFGGLHDPGARAVLAYARATGGGGAARVLAGGFRTARAAAVLANAAVSCTFDYDEILLLGHPGHSAVTVPLVLGEELGATYGDVLAAQVAADEVMGRLGLATVLGPQNGQLLPFLHCAGAAVAAGRLLGLDATRMAHALAVALAQPPAPLWPSFLGGFDVKVLTAAHGAAMGVTAAGLAQGGFTGALDLLDHPRGFFHRFAFVPFPRALGGLGRAWLTDTLQVKLHAACWYYQALLDAAIAARAELAAARGRPLAAADVTRVLTRVGFLAIAVDAAERDRPRDRLTANEVNFSIPAAVALALLGGRLVPADLDPAALAAREADVRALAARTAVVHDRHHTRRLLETLDGALDLAGLVGSASLADLGRAARAIRTEFPQHGTVRAGDVLASVASAPMLLARYHRGRGDYDLGAHDLANLTLPISATLELTLADGRRVEVTRDIPAGALTLPDAPARVRAKLRDAAAPALGAEAAARLDEAVAGARDGTPIAEVLAALG